MLEAAKQDLKELIIEQNSEEFYYKLIAEKTKKIHDFKKLADETFKKVNLDDEILTDDDFRSEFIRQTLKANEDFNED